MAVVNSTQGSGEEVFARRSSGLVRAASTTDASLVNAYVATFPIMVAFMLGIVLPFYLGANLFLAVIIGSVLAAPILLTYAVASSMLRRSGGDYVFISRLVHPGLGFAANFVFVAMSLVFLTSSGYYFCIWCLAPLAQYLGAEWSSTWLLNLSHHLSEPLAVFLVGELFVLGFGVLFAHTKTRTNLKVFRYTIPVSLVGLLAFIIATVMHSQSTLHANFDKYVVAAGGVHNATAAAAQSAASNGFALSPFSIKATLLAVTWTAFSMPFYLGSAYFAGEVRTGRKAQLLAGPLTGAAGAVGSLLLLWVAMGRLGSGFLGSVAAADPTKLGLSSAPTYMETAAGSSGHVILGVLIIVGFGSWLVPTVPMCLLLMTRCMLAWSMDRVAPSALSRVSPRTGSPFVAVYVVTAISAVVAWFWAYTTYFTVVVGAFGQIITMALGCLAAAFLPGRFKTLYATSPIGGYFGKVPRLTVIAILGVIGAVLLVVNFARDTSSGVSLSANPTMFWINIGLFPLGFVLYYIAVFFRRREGMDLSLAFKEIPPE